MKFILSLCVFLFTTAASALGCDAALMQTLPYIKQSTGFTCGPTSLMIALQSLGIITLPVDQFPNQVLSTACRINGITDLTKVSPIAISVFLNDGKSLAQVARDYGLFAGENSITRLDQLAMYVGNQERVLVHWLSGSQPYDGHWSVIQRITDTHIHLRDPWPTSPADHVMTLTQFLPRFYNGTMGLGVSLRISNKPLLAY